MYCLLENAEFVKFGFKIYENRLSPPWVDYINCAWQPDDMCKLLGYPV